MKLPFNIEAVFDLVLREFPGGIIAGGAVRDALLGYPIADIDLWIDVNASAAVSDWDPTPNADEYESTDDVSQVMAAGVKEIDGCPYPIHVMFTRRVDGEDPLTPTEVVQRFDYGLCRVAYSEQGLLVTPEFDVDHHYHRLSLVNSRYTSPTRFQKLKAKFVGWNVEEPKHGN